MNWGLEDFVAAAALLLAAGAGTAWALRRFERRGARTAAVAVILLAVALVWAELAVGIFH